MPSMITKKLMEEFKDREYFTRKDLWEFFQRYEPNLTKGTFGWRIYDLKNKSIIRALKRDLYMISDKPTFTPILSRELVKIAKQISNKFKDIKYCIWETQWLNEFIQHQSTKKIIIVEIEKDFVESVYYELKDFAVTELYFNPDNKIIEFYIAQSRNPLIIKKMITRSPIVKRTEKNINIYTPLPEKILVDIVAEAGLFNFLQGSEMINIYSTMLSEYTVNFTKLFSYAKRREKEQEIRQLIQNHMYHLINRIAI
jgi:hypothetical protein